MRMQGRDPICSRSAPIFYIVGHADQPLISRMVNRFAKTKIDLGAAVRNGAHIIVGLQEEIIPLVLFIFIRLSSQRRQKAFLKKLSAAIINPSEKVNLASRKRTKKEKSRASAENRSKTVKGKAVAKNSPKNPKISPNLRRIA